ncbi:helicase-like transcription factor [Myxocyprinus asiaticus]|uniref:helicase-like transcription factor n=1 Tax=Myxocyprinus asiaticus TaxID=70543 RepID=UPI002223557C|nr:helicase-like transcription factor [Myxocyprinus asiaticus]XP_051556685.1 helicase-like transcription factor [Myxocyprinus asiaticus]XP_051556686.1 helicase-like transcription factor [Myxocyprinus asiaticus]
MQSSPNFSLRSAVHPCSPSTSASPRYAFIDFLNVGRTETISQEIANLTEDSGQDLETEESVQIGTIQGTVVGLRYYSGVVNRGEMVSLVREPQNPYDRNAVMVANVYGRQVGHIKRELAAAMAYIMDNNLARVEGVVPYGEKNKFTMPVNLTFWGNEENREAVHNHMRCHGFRLGTDFKGGTTQTSSGRDPLGLLGLSSKITAIPLTAEELKNAFDKLFDDLMEDKTKEMEPAGAVCTPLLPHQKQALSWMTSRENSNDLPPFWEQKGGLYFNILTNFAVKERPEKVLGGILADDMGLGKTLTTIALIVSNFQNGKPLPLEKCEGSSKPSTSQKSSASKECKESEGSSQLKRLHVDSGTADTNEEDAEKSTPQKKAKSKRKTTKKSANTKKEVFVVDDLDFAAALDCSSTQVKPPKKRAKKSSGTDKGPSGGSGGSGARATLIVCPLSVLSTWLDQFEQHIRADVTLNVYLYYGAERKRSVSLLSGQDVVLTTYNVLSSDYGNKASSPLHKVNWLRVVLDEGHIIRNPSALQSKAVLELQSKRRWILSGTPIQNSLKDLYMLLSFLKLKPFDVKEWWNRIIQRPVNMGDRVGLKNLQVLVKGITLRRTKTSKVGGRTVVQLPERRVFVQHVTLSEEEREEYEQVKREGRNIIGSYFQEGTVMTNYADVLAILVHLRQYCCHPSLVGKYTGAGESVTPSELRERLINKITLVLNSGSDEECAVCLDSLRQPVITYCAHVFCRPCICEVIHSEKEQARCPLCRAQIKTKELVEYPGEEVDTGSTTGDKWRSSSKVDALMSNLLKLRNEDPTVKSLVVSQFTKFLNLLEVPLREYGFSFTRLDGSMNQKNRAQAIQDLQDSSPGSPTLMLLSLKAGGVGLNLTAASHVFLMDPAWNPAAEDQCVDRCHRLGQSRDVVITKFIVKDSVEENMVKIQKKKQELVEKAFGAKNPQDRKRAQIDDIRALMEI